MHRVRQDRCGYEVLRRGRPCAAHFDVEWEEKLNGGAADGASGCASRIRLHQVEPGESPPKMPRLEEKQTYQHDYIRRVIQVSLGASDATRAGASS